jgi:hypothetical protein
MYNLRHYFQQRYFLENGILIAILGAFMFLALMLVVGAGFMYASVERNPAFSSGSFFNLYIW